MATRVDDRSLEAWQMLLQQQTKERPKPVSPIWIESKTYAAVIRRRRRPISPPAPYKTG